MSLQGQHRVDQLIIITGCFLKYKDGIAADR
jgi:hypothetical protein